MSAWRHVRAIALLPGTVTLLIPSAVVLPGGVDLSWWRGLVAAPLLAGGFALWLWTVLLFARVGRGTLAPWDPTERLVVAGPYRHVRNPMIAAVAAFLLGEAVVFASGGLLVLLAAFIVVNHVFFLLHEEPALEGRFGEEYRDYKERVPRWAPRWDAFSRERGG